VVGSRIDFLMVCSIQSKIIPSNGDVLWSFPRRDLGKSPGLDKLQDLVYGPGLGSTSFPLFHKWIPKEPRDLTKVFGSGTIPP